jgi:hypothetical protein
MTRDEVVAEVDWLAGAGMSALYIQSALGKSAGALYKACWRAGRTDLMALFAPVRGGSES